MIADIIWLHETWRFDADRPQGCAWCLFPTPRSSPICIMLSPLSEDASLLAHGLVSSGAVRYGKFDGSYDDARRKSSDLRA